MLELLLFASDLGGSNQRLDAIEAEENAKLNLSGRLKLLLKELVLGEVCITHVEL